MSSDTDLLPALRRYWGYDSFRPLQEKIVRSLLAGRDACVVMPDRRREIAVLSIARGDAPGKNRDRRVTADRADAGSGRATSRKWEFRRLC